MQKKLSMFIIFIFISIPFFPEGEKGLKIKQIEGNQGKRWAICIGINDYEDENIGDLKKAQNDALSLGKVLEEKGQFDKVITMVNDEDHYKNKMLPTKSNIEKNLDFILEFATPNDLIIFAFSGHGISDWKGNGYLITLDTQLSKKFQTSIKVSDIVEKFKQHNISKTLLILDACREEMTQTKSLSNTKGLMADEFKETEIAATFYSTKAGWYSYEDMDSDYGVFTRFILEGLEGMADTNQDKVVTFSELETYVQKEVNDYSIKNNRKQKPYTKIYGEKYGDLALTTYLKTSIIEEEEFYSRKVTGNVTNFRVSLKAGEEYDTVILAWTPPKNPDYDGYIIFRNTKSSIDYSPVDKMIYLEGEKISATDITVLKLMDKNEKSYIDTNLMEGTEYFYKIFTFKNIDNLTYYSYPGVEKNINTMFDAITVNVKLDSIKVLEVNDSSWGAELYWTIKILTSTGNVLVLKDRDENDYWVAMKDDIKIFDDLKKDSLDITLPNKKESYIEIVINMKEKDEGVTDGWYKEKGTYNHLIKQKTFRYYINDDTIYKQYILTAEEKKSAKVEIKWTITKKTQ